MLLIFGMLTGIFAWYTWANPDEHRCFYDKVEHDAFEPMYLHLHIGNEYINVSWLFKIWCMCGVVICSIIMLYSLLGFIFYCTSNVTHAKLANTFLILGYCLATGWLVFGTVIRYNNSG